jgi:hemimethylated DNA binding protein
LHQIANRPGRDTMRVHCEIFATPASNDADGQPRHHVAFDLHRLASRPGPERTIRDAHDRAAFEAPMVPSIDYRYRLLMGAPPQHPTECNDSQPIVDLVVDVSRELPMVTSLSLGSPLSGYADAVRSVLDAKGLLASRSAQFPDGLDVCYTAGSVLKHRKFGYRGVIVGTADHTCTQPDWWIERMGVDRLPRGRYQPWYSVLVDVRDRAGGQQCYVCHDNIELWVASPEDLLPHGEPSWTVGHPIDHPDVRRAFTGYDELRGRYVVPRFM